MSKPVFISQPNKCDRCPVEGMLADGVPVGFKVANACHKAQEYYDVIYRLSDLGQTICMVYRRIKNEA